MAAILDYKEAVRLDPSNPQLAQDLLGVVEAQRESDGDTMNKLKIHE